MMRMALLVGLFLVACCPAWGDSGCAPHVEEHPGWRSASFRAHTDAFRDCPVSEGAYREVLAAWMEHRDPDRPALRSLSLGRAVDFPWLSGYLVGAALADPRWDARRGRLRRGDLNGWVASLLSAPPFLARLRAPFEGGAWRVSSVSVEKVLVGGGEDLPPGSAPSGSRAPFDAQLWLVLEPAPGPGREAGPVEGPASDQ